MHSLIVVYTDQCKKYLFSMVAIPLYVRHHVTFKEAGGGRMDITIGPKQTMGKTVS